MREALGLGIFVGSGEFGIEAFVFWVELAVDETVIDAGHLAHSLDRAVDRPAVAGAAKLVEKELDLELRGALAKLLFLVKLVPEGGIVVPGEKLLARAVSFLESGGDGRNELEPGEKGFLLAWRESFEGYGFGHTYIWTGGMMPGVWPGGAAWTCARRMRCLTSSGLTPWPKSAWTFGPAPGTGGGDWP